MSRSWTLPGLLRHELRLTFRTWFSRRPDGRIRGLAQMVITAFAILSMLGFGGIPLALLLRHREVQATPLIAVIGLACLTALFSLMLSQTLAASVALLYDRNDLDLLLSSPVSPSRVLTARAVSMSMSVAMIFIVVLTPLLVPIAVLGHPQWLAAYLVLYATALAAVGAGLMLAVVLMASIGPRRTRTFAQLLAALIGSAIFFLSQLQNIFGSRGVGNIWSRLAAQVRSGEVVLPAIASWPARAAMGEVLPLAAVVGVGVGVLGLAVLVLGRRFAENAAVAKGVGDSTPDRRAEREAVFRRGAFRALMVKELRLLQRDPGLMSQVLLRVLYIVPLVLVVVRYAHGGNLALVSAAAGLAFMAGQVTGSIAWITVSAEEAPELLAMSPTRALVAWRAKLLASVAPVAVLLAVPLAVLVWMSPLNALYTALGCAGAATCSGLTNIWLQKPSRRRDFRGRRDASLGATFAELTFCLLWGIAVGLAVSGYPLFSLAPLAIIAGLLLILRQSETAVLRRLAEAAT